jgi:thymidylate synthase (FAD)
MQDTKNRQNSIACDSEETKSWWSYAQKRVFDDAEFMYGQALKRGIAKEQARVLLPEGLTPSRLYMSGTMRSWIHYLKQRLDLSTQKEHRLIAHDVLATLRTVAPITMEAFFPEEI